MSSDLTVGPKRRRPLAPPRGSRGPLIEFADYQEDSMRPFRLLTIGGAALVTVSLAAQQTPRPQPAAPAPSTTSGPVNPKVEQYKKDVSLEVDGEREDIQRMNDQVFSF